MKLASSLIMLALVVIAPAFPGALEEHAAASALQVGDASVVVSCPLTVGGSFEAKTSALTGELMLDAVHGGEIGGTLAVDLRTLQTGIGLRDNHLKDKYLEVSRGPEYSAATLERIRLDGIDPANSVGKGAFRGLLTVHGQQREVSGVAEVRRAGHRLRVQASFPVKVSEFQIESPTYLGVGVKDEVSVAVTFNATEKD